MLPSTETALNSFRLAKKEKDGASAKAISKLTSDCQKMRLLALQILATLSSIPRKEANL